MPAIKSTPPKQPVFQFLSEKDLEKLVKAAVNNNLGNLLYKFTIEDLQQEVMLGLAIREYNPTKSKPSTFIYLVAKSILGSLYKKTYVSWDRHLEVPDFIVRDGEELNYMTDTFGTDPITPLDYLLTNEIANESNESGKVPVGFKRQYKNRV